MGNLYREPIATHPRSLEKTKSPRGVKTEAKSRPAPATQGARQPSRRPPRKTRCGAPGGRKRHPCVDLLRKGKPTHPMANETRVDSPSPWQHRLCLSCPVNYSQKKAAVFLKRQSRRFAEPSSRGPLAFMLYFLRIRLPSRTGNSTKHRRTPASLLSIFPRIFPFCPRLMQVTLSETQNKSICAFRGPSRGMPSRSNRSKSSARFFSKEPPHSKPLELFFTARV